MLANNFLSLHTWSNERYVSALITEKFSNYSVMLHNLILMLESLIMNSFAEQLSTCQKPTFFQATHTVIHCSGISQPTGQLTLAIQCTLYPSPLH